MRWPRLIGRSWKRLPKIVSSEEVSQFKEAESQFRVAQLCFAEEVRQLEERLRSALELRSHLAVGESQAYADQGLHVFARSINALELSVREFLARDIESRVSMIDSSLATYQDVSAREMRNVEARIEFIRRELLYELQTQLARRISGSTSPQSSPRVIDEEKLGAMRTKGIRLNVGCGHLPIDEYLNVDQRDLPGVEVVAPATALPFAPGEIKEIASSHLVEHFSAHMLTTVVLPHWRELLESNGTLIVVAPDGEAMLKAISGGGMTFEDFREVLFGAQDYEGDYHYNLLTPSTLADSLTRAGFVNVEIVYDARRNGKSYECKLIARKPVD